MYTRCVSFGRLAMENKVRGNTGQRRIRERREQGVLSRGVDLRGLYL